MSLSLSENSKDIVVERSFSNKLRINGRFSDFIEKIESYVSIISGPAMEKYDVNPYTFRTVEQAQKIQYSNRLPMNMVVSCLTES